MGVLLMTSEDDRQLEKSFSVYWFYYFLCLLVIVCMDFQRHDSLIFIDYFLKKVVESQLEVSFIAWFLSFHPVHFHLFMYTFPLCINKQYWTAAFLFCWLLLSVKLCPRMITISGIHCYTNAHCCILKPFLQSPLGKGTLGWVLLVLLNIQLSYFVGVYT
jgi:hypothetical protein